MNKIDMNRKVDKLDNYKSDNKVGEKSRKEAEEKRGMEDLAVGMGEAVDDLALQVRAHCNLSCGLRGGCEIMEKTMD